MERLEVGGFHDFEVDDGVDVAGVDDEFERSAIVDADFDAGRAFAIEERDFGEEFDAGEGRGSGLGMRGSCGECNQCGGCGQDGDCATGKRRKSTGDGHGRSFSLTRS